MGYFAGSFGGTILNDIEIAKLEKMLDTVQKPARYTGGEMNSVRKDWKSVRCTFGFCFADTYEIGMSHLGMKILYYLINQRKDALCERLFMPDADMADKMRETGVPLFSLETRAALNEFDIIGFTLQYEMSYTNIQYSIFHAVCPCFHGKTKGFHD